MCQTLHQMLYRNCFQLVSTIEQTGQYHKMGIVIVLAEGVCMRIKFSDISKAFRNFLTYSKLYI